MPASRRRQDQAHARPWPGPEHTAHQLAAATCSCTWCTLGPVVRAADALALLAILQHADSNRAGQRRARIEHLASVAGHGRIIDLVDVRTLPRIHPSPCRRQGRARRLPGPGQDRGARRTSWRPRLQLHLVRARAGNALRRYTRPAGQPAARRR